MHTSVVKHIVQIPVVCRRLLAAIWCFSLGCTRAGLWGYFGMARLLVLSAAHFASVSDTSRWQWLKWVLLRVLLSVILGLVFGFAVAEALNANEPITGESEYEDDDDHDLGIMVYWLLIAIVSAVKMLFDIILIAYLQVGKMASLEEAL